MIMFASVLTPPNPASPIVCRQKRIPSYPLYGLGFAQREGMQSEYTRVTVLAAYQRLEAEGVWRADENAQCRDVIVAIGDATLTITDSNEIALAHWSLAAIRRLNPGEHPALFSPGADAPETLEISDRTMIAAIGKVLKAIGRKGAHPGRLRILGIITAAVILAYGAIFWLPGALASYTAGILPDAARVSIGRNITGHISQLTGVPCDSVVARRALDILSLRLFPDRQTRIEVLPSALSTTQHVPGGTILVSHTLVEDFETPDVLAGYLIAESIRREELDPLERTLRHAGLSGAFRILTAGELKTETLKTHAERLITEKPPAVATDQLAARAKSLGVSLAGYASANGGDTEAALRDLQPASATSALLLSDSDWLALQQVCER